jgi:hypothetical protein
VEVTVFTNFSVRIVTAEVCLEVTFMPVTPQLDSTNHGLAKKLNFRAGHPTDSESPVHLKIIPFLDVPETADFGQNGTIKDIKQF